MMFKLSLSATALVVATAIPASAMDAKIHLYHSKHNYCPQGLQPVVVGGVICCGTPNTSVTYSQMMRHPVAKKTKAHKGRRMVCPAGEKGCYYQ